MILNDNPCFKIEDLLGSKARIKILKALAREGELTITSIIKMTGLNHKNVLKHLTILKKFDIIQEKKFGRIKIYRFKNEELKAKSFKSFLNIWEGF
ncbi:MAG: ArsR/SmtB family transcription factor [Promethearchaeota archaeon]